MLKNYVHRIGSLQLMLCLRKTQPTLVMAKDDKEKGANIFVLQNNLTEFRLPLN